MFGVQKQSKKSAGEKKKTSTGGKKTSKPLPKPKTKAQINRQEKMKALSEMRKKENWARKNKVLE